MKLLYSGGVLVFLFLVNYFFVFSEPVFRYGYDYGFYHHTLQHLGNLGVYGVWGDYTNALFFLNYLFGLSPEIFLTILLILGSTTTAYFLYKYVPDKKRGLSIAALFLISPWNLEMGYQFLLKTALGLPLVLGAIYFYEKKKYWHVILMLGLLLLTHRTSLIVAAGVILVDFIIRQRSIRKISLAILGGAALAGIGAYLRPDLVSGILSNNNKYVGAGIFLFGQNIWVIILPLIIGLGIMVWNTYKTNIRWTVWGTGSVLLIIWLILQLPFHNRLVPYLAIFLLLVVAGIKDKRWFVGIASATLVFNLVFTNQLINNKSPIATEEDVIEIQEVTEEYKPTVIAVDANDATALWAWALDSNVVAPGLFGDDKKYEDWKNFWENRDQINFLAEYKKPILLYQRSYQIQGDVDKCLEQVSNHFYLFDCK